MDFTLSKYKTLLRTLQDKGYQFLTFYDYLNLNQSSNHPINPQPATQNPQPSTWNQELGTQNPERIIILRHDVDLKPQNSMITAEIEHHLGIKGSYYFRMIPVEKTLMKIFADLFKSNPASSHLRENPSSASSRLCENPSSASSRLCENPSSASSRLCENPYNPKIFNPDIIRYIAALGHEVGYHYETMDTVSTSSRSRPVGGRSDLLFKDEKDYFVESSKKNETPCNDEIIDAAYQLFCFNLDTFRQIANIKTICMHGSPRSKFDNREIWNKYNYRELGIVGEPYFDIDFNEFFYLTDTGRRWDGHRVSVRDKMQQQERWNSAGLRFRSTKDIIKAANENRLPSKIMITVHPQRWNKSFTLWAKELVFQNVKNIVKRIIIGNS
jgi:hypothetical protein